MTPNELRVITDALIENDLAPAGAAVADLAHDDQVLVKVELPATDPRKVHWLTNWLDVLMDPIDMVAGKFRRSDDLLRLNIRGLLNNGAVAVVVAPFSETTEPSQVAIIRAAIDDQDPVDLVDQLAELDTRGEA
jgi:hypothetical protein